MKRVSQFIGLAALLVAQGTWASGYTADPSGCKAFDLEPMAAETIAFSGGCLDGYLDGPGRLQWFINGKQVSEQTGTFVRGMMEGAGTKAYPGGTIYTGYFSHGLRSGHGEERDPNGIVTTGEWRDRAVYGPGTRLYKDGTLYKGIFENGAVKGQGSITYPDGRVYVGELFNGPIGEGRTTWPDGTSLDGVHEGLFTVSGRFTTPIGEVISGDFVLGRQEDPRLASWNAALLTALCVKAAPNVPITSCQIPLDKSVFGFQYRAKLSPTDTARVGGFPNTHLFLRARADSSGVVGPFTVLISSGRMEADQKIADQTSALLAERRDDLGPFPVPNDTLILELEYQGTPRVLVGLPDRPEYHSH